MKENKLYKIDTFGLKIGVHEYQFEFDEKLFAGIEERMIDSGQGECKLVLTKKETMIELSFLIKGTIELTCDRSMETFDHPVELTENLILKYGEEFDDSRDDIWIIPSTQESINIEQPLYEYLTMAVPMKKLHPKFGEQDDEDGLELVYSSEGDEVEDTNEELVDPRWEALKNIKNSNK